MMKPADYAKIIDEVFDGVCMSKIGKKAHVDEYGTIVMCEGAFNVFMNILSNRIPKVCETTGTLAMESPKEPWQE